MGRQKISKGKKHLKLRISAMMGNDNVGSTSPNSAAAADRTVDDQQQANENDVYKHKGQIMFCMNKFKAFSEGTDPKEVLSEPVVYINGLPWRILLKYNNATSFGLFLCCFGDETDMVWNCVANKQLGIVSGTKGGKKCQMIEGNSEDHHTFDAMSPRWGKGDFAKFEEVMDEKNGFYNSTDDSVTFKAEVVTQEPKGMPGLRLVDSLLINGHLVHVNKFNLAAHSPIFRKEFFGQQAVKTPKFNYDEDIGDIVPAFERFMATMYPTNAELNDSCIEAVLQLANYFQTDSVVHKCANFLLTKSEKSAICKFRLAHQCGITGMKQKVLKAMNRADFEVTGPNFMDVFLDYNKLDGYAVNELGKRHKEIFGRRRNEENKFYD